MTAPQSPRRALRQQIETSLLMGVDFVPLGDSQPGGFPPETDSPVASSPSPGQGKTEALEALHQEHDTRCPHCTETTAHTRTVFGEGNPDASLMFVGEARGAEEDRTGRPFVGRAGKKLDEMIAAIGLRREDVYIANVIKSRPPDNRTPLPDEVSACSPYLVRQIRIVEPRVIMCLGSPATKLLLDTTEGISKLRGRWATFDDGIRLVDVLPTFHPAYLLRNYTRDTREKVWSDLQAVQSRLA